MMKKITCLLLSCTVFYFHSIASDKDSLAVVKAVQALSTAMINGVAADLYAITAPQLSYGHSSGAVDTQSSFVEKISTGQSDFVSIDIADQSILFSGNTAIVRHKLKAVTNDQGKSGQVQLNIMLVWQKQKNKWVLLARQAVKLVVP